MTKMKVYKIEMDKEAVLKEYLSGTPVTTLCRRLGCSDQTIYNRLQDWGVKPRGHLRGGKVVCR